MTNLEALEKLYISLGGVESDLEGVSTTAEVIDLIKDVAGGGGSGADRLIVHVKKENPEAPAIYDPDEITPSVDDIFDAFEEGKDISVIVHFIYSNPNDGSSVTVEYALPLISWNMVENYECMAFSAKNMCHTPFQDSDQTEPRMDLVTLTLWKSMNRKAILYYSHEDMDN